MEIVQKPPFPTAKQFFLVAKSFFYMPVSLLKSKHNVWCIIASCCIALLAFVFAIKLNQPQPFEGRMDYEITKVILLKPGNYV